MKRVLPEIDLDRCTGCGECVVRCPKDAVAVVGGKVTIVKPENCNYCADCEDICPTSAISCPFEIVLVSPQQRKRHSGGKSET